ncbi:MAG: LysM peptidoglycan-binding domain-containing protein [Bacteroidetes bacterium]|nr:LysM peptidoglycan-binding domain-containing protein [Bacteroidota bacterium]
MSNNCPICNKAGLPDYTKINVVCPQCNSDLKAFMLLNSISQPQKSKIGTYVIIGVSVLSIAFLGMFLQSNSDKKELIAKNFVLNDSISKIQNVNIKLGTQKKNEQQPIVENLDVSLKYKVKKGDYPYKIAEFFYNDGSKYKQIEADNNLKQPYTLQVGQILIIKLSQE